MRQEDTRMDASMATRHRLGGDVDVAVVHPGEMGAAIGAALVEDGRRVHWASVGRSPETTARAGRARLIDDGDLETLLARSDLVISICPPHAALKVAAEIVAAAKHKRHWIYLDANAIAPATASGVAQIVEDAGARYVDGGIIGPPPVAAGFTRLYLSGLSASEVTEVLATPLIDVHVLNERPCSASALKLSYAAWTKGSAALLLAARAAAARAGVAQSLLEEWHTSQPGLEDRWGRAQRSALEKGWRWSGEMREIASMLEELGLPSGFHSAAAEVFENVTTLE
jgi:3-hydroxyisobutyrate dehydrogenase-like beta-hydroxyacid dehydrogenase